MSDDVSHRTDFPRRVAQPRDTWIPMPDGTRLSARVWLPQDAGDNPVPGILELLPYRKSDGTSLRDSRHAPWFAGHGYAVVRVDVRGTGNSEGIILDEYTREELEDGVACIAWIAAQRWCSGRVGMMGISWGGFNALQVAALQPPALHAVLSLCSTDDRYADDVHYWGGALLADYQLPWATTMLARTALPPEPEAWGEAWREQWLRRLDQTPPFIEEWIRHQRRDSFWQHGSVCEDPAAIRCPVFLVGGWADAYRDAVFRMLETLEVPRRGLVGPWSHAWPQAAVPGPRIGFLQEALRWWDRWLKDERNGVDDEPLLQAWMQAAVPPKGWYAERPGRWVVERSWPSAHVRHRRLELGPEAAHLDEQSAAAGRVVVAAAQSHGVLGGRSCSYGKPFDQPVDQRTEDALAVCFDTAELTEPLEILGIVQADLDVSADRPEALVAVRLCDVAPDGSSTLVTRGLLNLTHRDGHEHPRPLEPHTRYRVRFPLHAIGYAFPVGHRLRVALAPTYWPLAWPSPEPAQLMLHTPGSALLLPVRIAGPDRTESFAAPEQAQPFEHEPTQRSAHGTVTRDLSTGRVTVVNESAGGLTRTEHGQPTRLHSLDRDFFEIVDDEPTSAVVRSHRTVELSRGDWAVRVEATGELSCDKETFHVRTSLTAYEGDATVFERTWQISTPRDLT